MLNLKPWKLLKSKLDITENYHTYKTSIKVILNHFGLTVPWHSFSCKKKNSKKYVYYYLSCGILENGSYSVKGCKGLIVIVEKLLFSQL